MDERVERLLGKAELAIDQNETDRADQYRVLANVVAYHRKQEAKAMNRVLDLELEGSDDN